MTPLRRSLGQKLERVAITLTRPAPGTTERFGTSSASQGFLCILSHEVIEGKGGHQRELILYYTIVPVMGR